MSRPGSERATRTQELVVITKAHDLVREMTRRAGKFPRDFTSLLGDRILTNACDVLDLLIEAKYTQARPAALERGFAGSVSLGNRVRSLSG